MFKANDFQEPEARRLAFTTSSWIRTRQTSCQVEGGPLKWLIEVDYQTLVFTFKDFVFKDLAMELPDLPRDKVRRLH